MSLAGDRKRSVAGSAATRLPVFVNPASGSVKNVLPLLEAEQRIRLESLPPKQLAERINQEVEQGQTRLAVCGGDGTLALAAAQLAGRDTELAVLPGGTLNHFATHLGLPKAFDEALELAISGQAQPVAAGYVNDRLFLNTSSVGAYVTFVRTREQLERKMSYPLATLLAGFHRLLRFRSAKLNINGKVLRSPLVFVGVNERELSFPVLGAQKPSGSYGLHLIAVKSRTSWQTLSIACKAMLLGIDPLEQANDVETCILEQLELSYHRGRRKLVVALDGELVKLEAPLAYRFAEKAFKVVTPGS